MNQILLQVLSQDPSKTPGICLTFRWMLPLLPHLETIGGLFVIPLLGTWLGHVFLDIDDLWAQVFSVTGLVYLSTLVAMIPKPNTSSKLWIDANIFTIITYALYFIETAFIASLGLTLSYSMGWIASITFSTVSTILVYTLLTGLRLSKTQYLKTIISIYFFSDIGNILALGVLSPYYTYQIFLLMGGLIFFYLWLPYPNSLLSSQTFKGTYDKNPAMLRCLLWGALAVWSDYSALTSFYLLEMILASESHQKKRSIARYFQDHAIVHKTKVWKILQSMGDTASKRLNIVLACAQKQKIPLIMSPILPFLSTPLLKLRPQLYSRNL